VQSANRNGPGGLSAPGQKVFFLKAITRAHAMRKAQLQRLSIYPEQPNLWSGFVLYGEPK
jgi:hypothetical protein